MRERVREGREVSLMPDETVYKRGEKGRKIAKELKESVARIRFKDRSFNIRRIISIGRDEKNDITVTDDPLVSRHHALIEKEGDHYFVMDKGSTNGTYVNNNPLPGCERVEVKRGDVITVGKTKLEIL
jgi:pSer/pThr/pTyr-binding forkhead associated (FHA) protein